MDRILETLLTEKDLCERWRVSVKKLQSDRLIGGGCVFVKIGRSVRYRLADVQDFEAAHIRSTTGSSAQSLPTKG